MSKAAALEEMYLIYQAMRGYWPMPHRGVSVGWQRWWRPTAPSANSLHPAVCATAGELCRGPEVGCLKNGALSEITLLR
jgi:hypothetical protein